MEIQEPITSVDADAWFGALLTNLKASFVVTQAFLRYAVPSATIVNASSGLAHLDVRPRASPYCTAKAAAVRFFQGLIYENPGLHVVNLHPSIVTTEAAKRSGAIEGQDEIDLPASFTIWLASSEAKFLKEKFVWANWDVGELKGRAKEIRGTNFLDIGLTGWPFSA
ncbi:hypothetical protein B0O99DRAFT_217551 [Bisporella sp. PMI_857]|nr:hypothetical protein B0O99DRAFT_217551 [Bisporella sp. PMI_857]